MPFCGLLGSRGKSLLLQVTGFWALFGSDPLTSAVCYVFQVKSGSWANAGECGESPAAGHDAGHIYGVLEFKSRLGGCYCSDREPLNPTWVAGSFSLRMGTSRTASVLSRRGLRRPPIGAPGPYVVAQSRLLGVGT